MNRQEFTGKTTEEAINEGLRKLGCTISDVKVEVLEEGAKGLFGLFGSKQARVLITLNEEEDFDVLGSLQNLGSDRPAKERERAPKPKPAPAPKPQQAESREPRAPKEPVSDAAPKAQSEPAAPKPERAPRAPQPRVHAPREPRPVQPREPRPERAPRPERERTPLSTFVPTPVQMDVPVVMHDPASPLGVAQQFLLELTRLMGVPVRVDAEADPEGNLFVQMTGDTLGILIGRRGETLDSLQYLTSLQVNKDREGYIRVTLDTENYRAKREDSLRRLATRMATRAHKTGHKVALEPMNPYERRILHASLQDHPHVTTHSEGEEPNRHVVITVKQ